MPTVRLPSQSSVPTTPTAVPADAVVESIRQLLPSTAATPTDSYNSATGASASAPRGDSDGLPVGDPPQGANSPNEIDDLVNQIYARQPIASAASATRTGLSSSGIHSPSTISGAGAAATPVTDSNAIDAYSGYGQTYAQELADPSLRASTGTEYAYGPLTTNFNLYPSGSPTLDDVTQGSMNDCYLAAPLASLAQNNPAAITSAISQTPGKAGYYDVKMFDPAGKPVTVTVSNSEILDKQGKQAGIVGEDGKANWASIMEKAYSKYNAVYQISGNSPNATDGVSAMANTGFTNDAMTAFTGQQTVTSATTSSDDAIANQMTTALRGDEPVVANTNKSSANAEFLGTTASGVNLVASHSYTVENVDQDASGTLWVTLRNPWDDNKDASGASRHDEGLVRMSMAEYKRFFAVTVTTQAAA